MKLFYTLLLSLMIGSATFAQGTQVKTAKELASICAAGVQAADEKDPAKKADDTVALAVCLGYVDGWADATVTGRIAPSTNGLYIVRFKGDRPNTADVVVGFLKFYLVKSPTVQGMDGFPAINVLTAYAYEVNLLEAVPLFTQGDQQ